MSFEHIQDGRHGSHLGYQNGMIFAILNLHVAPMPNQVWVQSDLGFWSRCGFKIFKMVAMRQLSWIPDRNNFSNSESLCSSNASHQVSAQSDLWFGRRCHLKNFKVAATAASWIQEQKDFSHSESLCHFDASNQVLAQSNLRFGRGCHLKNFKILDTATE